MKDSINEGSKIIAEYLGWKYFPFNDLQGLPKAGWYEVVPKTDKKEEVIITSFNIYKGKKSEENIEKKQMNLDFIRYNAKNGWGSTDKFYYKYICRHHADLRFYNSMDALLEVIEKLEKEDLSANHYSWECIDGESRNNFQKLSFVLYDKRCYSEVELDLDPPIEIASGNEDGLSWIQNTFNCVVSTIEYVNKAKNQTLTESLN